MHSQKLYLINTKQCLAIQNSNKITLNRTNKQTVTLLKKIDRQIKLGKKRDNLKYTKLGWEQYKIQNTR